MKLYEYLAKGIFRTEGIPLPEGGVAQTPEEALAIAKDIGYPVAIKSQVLAGGRGKAGGIAFANNEMEVINESARILGSELKGLRVGQVLIEEKLKIDKEYYVSITVDNFIKKPIILASSQGGVDIEDVSEEYIVKKVVDMEVGVYPYLGREIARKMGIKGELMNQFSSLVIKMYDLFRKYEAELVEINPLVRSGDKLIALDARLNVDDDALYRHQDLPRIVEGEEWEIKAKALGLSYVQLDGDIAVMANGAGITMATLDLLAIFGGKPANFLDAGGGAAVEPMAKALSLLNDTKPKVIFINIFGGITRCDDVARAIIEVRKSTDFSAPLVIRLTGTREEEAIQLLQENSLSAYKSMEEAARKAVALSKPSSGCSGGR
ncbi:MAG: Succinate--CoA ligase (GDP-forming) subunit beta [candidate division WS2 bacterium]|nr:Succinate--CoA ligase (GDP-forming) subunit beta [Candidatus Lithacetigena glycinireducens]MBT9175019.1 Succinate--CoA ligase (GDP-forming) subunit beta [Candidatus Lithacetigena glycinireducens]